MFSAGEEHLTQYATELPPLTVGHSCLLLINNSSLPLDKTGSNPVGVMHKAVVESPDRNQHRIINSTMLAAGIEELSQDIQQEFVTTDHVSRRAY